MSFSFIPGIRVKSRHHIDETSFKFVFGWIFLFSFIYFFFLNAFWESPRKNKRLREKGTCNTLFYYMNTEKFSPKSYVVNFRTQISSSQSEERTMVFKREKNDTSNQNRERCFFTCEKNDTPNQKPQRCVSFAPKFPPFIAACSAASRTFNEKSFTQRVFLPKKSEKHFGNGVE